MLMIDNSPLFHELSPAERARMTVRCAREHFAAGDCIIAEGDTLDRLYLLTHGLADVLVLDGAGQERRVNRLGAGDVLGEMAPLSGQPAAATIRAATAVEALVLTHEGFHDLSLTMPRLYRNLGAMLSRRLASANQLAVRRLHGRSALLLDSGAPPLLGFALASSVAWHTRQDVLLVVVSPDSGEGTRNGAIDLLSDRAYAGPHAAPGNRAVGPGARLITVSAEGPYSPSALAVPTSCLLRQPSVPAT
jgi:CRP-like cAMP-binding protein